MIPQALLSHMRVILEDAPPLAYHAAAVFLQREQARWTQLSEDASLLEDRFGRFLHAPSSWDLIQQHIREGQGDWKETHCTRCNGKVGNPGTCPSCNGKGWYWQNTKTGTKDQGYGNPVKYGRVNEARTTRMGIPVKCAVCGQTKKPVGRSAPMYGPSGCDDRCKGYRQPPYPGSLWPGETEDDFGYPIGDAGTKRVTVNEEGEGGAPANAAGNGGVAGIGQPPGSAFGEPGVHLGGATTKTKKKNKRPEDLNESTYSWVCQKCGKIWGPADDVPKKCPRCGSTEARRRDDAELDESNTSRKDAELDTCIECNGKGESYGETCPTCGGAGQYWISKTTGKFVDYALDEAVSDKDVETAAKAVHDRWVKNQKAAGETEHKSPDGKEDYMVPYEKLSDKSKEMDREAVRATLDTLKIDEANQQAYRGYLIQTDFLGRVSIRKDGQHIAWAKSPMDARTQIELLLWKAADDDELNYVDEGLNEDTFAGAQVFDVPMDKWMASRFGKNRYHRYSRYVGKDELGETIRNHGRSTKQDIVLKDQTTGVMTYLRRKGAK